MTLLDIGDLIGATILGNPEREIFGVAPLSCAIATDLGYVDTGAQAADARGDGSRAILTSVHYESYCAGLDGIVSSEATEAFETLRRYFILRSSFETAGIHPTAIVHPGAQISPTALIGPHCVVSDGVVVGEHALLLPGTIVERGARLGAGTIVGPQAWIGPEVVLGRLCSVECGVRLGSAGTAFIPGDTGMVRDGTSGGLVLEDRVEIGPNTVVERGTFSTTRIGRGTLVGGQVYIGHDTEIAHSCLIIAQCVIGSEVRMERGATLMARVAVGCGARIGERALVNACSGVFAEVEANIQVFGMPARPRTEALRALGAPRKVERLQRRVVDLEKRLTEVEIPLGR